VVFRRDNKVDAFQRQMSALRQQLGGSEEEQMDDREEPAQRASDTYATGATGDRYGSQSDYASSDAGGYSFGNYPPPASSASGPVELDQPEVPEFPAVDGQVSIIAQDTLWKGDLESDGSMHVHGRVDGNLRAKDDVWVAEGAEVSATISARRIVVAGQVNGTIRALDRFEALPQARVGADVYAPTFVVHEGAMINGQLHMARDQGTPGSESRAGGTPAVIQRRAARPGA
jgi:cytoskeletal protein CcmA (bactofilin family)